MIPGLPALLPCLSLDQKTSGITFPEPGWLPVLAWTPPPPSPAYLVPPLHDFPHDPNHTPPLLHYRANGSFWVSSPCPPCCGILATGRASSPPMGAPLQPSGGTQAPPFTTSLLPVQVPFPLSEFDPPTCPNLLPAPSPSLLLALSMEVLPRPIAPLSHVLTAILLAPRPCLLAT